MLIVAEFATPHNFCQRSEENLVRRTTLQRKLIEGTEGKSEAIPLALDNLILAAELDFFSLKILASRLLEHAL